LSPVKSTFFFAQDSIVRKSSDSIPYSSIQNDTVSGLKKFSAEEVNDIFLAMERKERELDSIARVRSYYAYLRSLEQNEPEGFDTAAVPYNFTKDSIPSSENPLNHLNQRFFSYKDTRKPVFLEKAETTQTKIIIEDLHDPAVSASTTHDLRPDWLLGVIIGSLVLLAWLKLFYNKFLDQTIKSITNYQLSTKLLRDQNIFSRRVAFFLNLNFIIIGAAFIYLIFGFFQLRPFPLNDILSYLAYAGVLSGLMILRFIVSHITGHVFRKHYAFREYLHQLFLIYKNLGLYLLILVIGIAYIQEDFRVYLVYFSGLLVIAAFILRVVKGFKIILTDKDVLIFYLILYLCTLEILPLLIFYRFFSSSVLTG